MLAQKVFLKKTKRGNIIKEVREHYLRDDIRCGHPKCQKCDLVGSVNKALLTENPISVASVCLEPHYIVVDTNIVLEHIDALESEGFCNVIILQTVLDEVRHRSSPIYKRLKDIISNPARNFWVFVNEHRKETYVERQPGESANDRNDRAIRVACAWFNKHWKEEVGAKHGKAILLSDDKANRDRAESEKISSFSSYDYVESMKDFPSLVDKLKQKDGKGDGFSKRFLFPEHLAPAQINAGIKSGRYLKGVFYQSRTSYLEGSVNVEGKDPILVQGLEHMNRSVDGDTVAVQLLKKEDWSAPLEVVLEDDGFDSGDTLDPAKKLVSESAKSKDTQLTARVVGIVRRKWRQYCGMLQSNPVKGSNRHIFVAAEKKIPKVRIETRQSDKLIGQRIIVAIDSWPRSSRYPVGHFVRALGKLGDKATENEVLLLEHDIPHSKFSDAVLECLPEMPWTITAKDKLERVDCRHLNICSVDPPGCTDIDDALHAMPLPNGNYEVGVHIADVSHFIRPGTAIDQEAANRSTTVYLTDRRIDMVPELLSSNLCSLRDDGDRFAFSCVWEMDQEANIVATRFHKSIIRSRSSMTYEDAQNRIDDKADTSDLTESLRILLKLSKLLKARRIEAGALLLASSEVRFNVDSETADPIDVQAKVMRETNSMVEEFMLAANISAATRIHQNFPDCAMLRRHPAPPASNFDPLVKAAKQQGHEIIIDSGKQLADTLNAATDAKRPYLNTMLRMIATRCMMQAVYFASGTIEEPLFRHYGLACPIYTHFTSPIRRYADVIVHRLLAVSIQADSTYAGLVDKKQTQKIAENINYRHRMAQYAGRASVNLFTHLYFRNKKRDETGYILYIRQNAIQVLIPKYGLEGTLFLNKKKRKDEEVGADTELAWHFNEDEPSVTLDGHKLSLFQKLEVQVELDSTDIQHEKLVLSLVKPAIPGYSVAPAPPLPEEEESSTSKVSQEKDGARKRKSDGSSTNDQDLKEKNKKKMKKSN
eukprot:TRINITY_DN15618_c0_g1_i4.p1 TRINITY_DN15618_c0_g1~~TRINITY_DN15618_c0_g1_i4.p1  ORF type:complete len:992 (-),score=249.26 TRINITY_DN15618_c0_g1_i4:1-2976(-)